MMIALTSDARCSVTLELERAAGLQRERTSSIVGQSDRVAVFDDRLPSETSHLAQHRANPVRSLIRDPAQIRAPEDELFVLSANAPFCRRFAAGFEVLDKLPLVGDRRSRRTRSGRHPRRNSSGNVAAARLSNRFNQPTQQKPSTDTDAAPVTGDRLKHRHRGERGGFGTQHPWAEPDARNKGEFAENVKLRFIEASFGTNEKHHPPSRATPL